MLIDKNQKQLGHKSPGDFHFRKKLNNFKCLVNGYESVSVLNALPCKHIYFTQTDVPERIE